MIENAFYERVLPAQHINSLVFDGGVRVLPPLTIENP